VLDVRLTDGADGRPATVWAVLFWGELEAEPRGIANLLACQDLVMRYGTPCFESNGGHDAKYLYFPNGLMVWLDAGKVGAYGVYAPQR